MTSVLNVDTIADKAGTGPVALTKQSAAKAWVNFNGTGTAVINDSINISSLTDNDTGQFTFAFSNAMNNATYSITATSGSSNSWSSTEFIGAYATSSFKIETGATNSSARADWSNNNGAIHGDLA